MAIPIAMQMGTPDIFGSFQRGASLEQARLGNQLKLEEAQRQAEQAAQVNLLQQQLAGQAENPLGQLAALSPQLAGQITGYKQSQQDRQTELSGRLAQGILSAPPEQQQQSYQQALVIAKNSGLDTSELPQEYTPEMAPMLQQMAGQARSVKDIASEQFTAAGREQQTKENEIERQARAREAAANRANQMAMARLTAQQQKENMIFKMNLERQVSEASAQEPDKIGSYGGVKIEQLAQSNAGVQQQKMRDTDFIKNMRKKTDDYMKQENQLKRLDALLKSHGTGPGVAVEGWFGFSGPYAEMKSISTQLALGQREPGTGPMSDKDLEVFQSTVFDPSKPETYNKNWLEGARAAINDKKSYRNFVTMFERKNGNLQGVEDSWRMYQDSNPIFEDISGEEVKLNKNRKSWQKFNFDAARKLEEQGMKLNDPATHKLLNNTKVSDALAQGYSLEEILQYGGK